MNFVQPPQLTIKQLEPMFKKLRITSSGCWECRYLQIYGYGVIYFRGIRYRAHRLIFAQFSPSPDIGVLDHLMCSNRACVNPRHIVRSTPTKNTRRSLGQLTDEQVHFIRTPVGMGTVGRELANRFGVTESIISKIKCNRTYTVWD